MAGYSDGFGGAADAFSFFSSAGSKPMKKKLLKQRMKAAKKAMKKEGGNGVASWVAGGGSVSIRRHPAGSSRGGQFKGK